MGLRHELFYADDPIGGQTSIVFQRKEVSSSYILGGDDSVETETGYLGTTTCTIKKRLCLVINRATIAEVSQVPPYKARRLVLLGCSKSKRHEAPRHASLKLLKSENC